MASENPSGVTTTTASVTTLTSPIYFWRPPDPNAWLSQWWPAPFTDPSSPSPTHVYPHAEQYMMHRKALAFAPNQKRVISRILTESDPMKCRMLGREVPVFDEKRWKGKRYRIAREGNLLKFRQNRELKEKLLATGERELVEASARDRDWGIGYIFMEAVAHRGEWGDNLLGKALMEVRDILRMEEEGGEGNEDPDEHQSG